MPIKCGTTLPSTWPQMPTVRSPTLSLSAIRMSQVEVPMTFTSALGWLRAGANGAHVAVEGAAGDGHTLRQTQALGPLCAQRADRHIGRPVSVNSGQARCWLMMGSSSSKKLAGGRPPQLSCHSDLCPALQQPRRRSCGRVVPESRAGTQSQSSTHEAAAGRRRYLRG